MVRCQRMGRRPGHAVADSLQRLARRARSSTWPEYAELDCIACHHSLTAPKDSWCEEAGYAGRTPGVPAWNAARFVVFRYAAVATDATAAGKLEAEVATLSSLMGQLNGDREQIAASAERAAALADSLARELDDRAYDQAFTLQVMRRIAADPNLSLQGQRAAEQAAMSLDSLYNVCKQGGAPDNNVQTAIAGLFAQVQNPSAYNAPSFAAQLQRVGAALGRGLGRPANSGAQTRPWKTTASSISACARNIPARSRPGASGDLTSANVPGQRTRGLQSRRLCLGISHSRHGAQQGLSLGEDGIAGICDRYQLLVFALALWNGRDPILKERMFGLSGNEGNHGEDANR